MAYTPPGSSQSIPGNFKGETARPLRYYPDGTDFVITNGSEFFNRPLYCINTACRVDGGDKPEFSLYLPGRGGNLRFGIKTDRGVKWLNDAEHIVTRYRPESLIFEVHDESLGNGELCLTVLPLAQSKGCIARAEVSGSKPDDPIQLIWAFGGANGMRGKRGGDIGCESKPVSEFFQLHPEQCAGNEFSILGNRFLLKAKPGQIAGLCSPGSEMKIADANDWNAPAKLLASSNAPTKLPLLMGSAPIQSGRPIYVALEVEGEGSSSAFTNFGDRSQEILSGLFEQAEQHRLTIANKLVVNTPDPFVNAAASALCVAADGIWDSDQQSFMHGAVAWRVRLLGWRGMYAGDELGWHERTAEHFAGYAREQNTNPVPTILPPADANVNLSRNETGLHSNGDLTKSHYDMNLVAVDAFFRHLLWTGDLDYARKMWPVIERHFAWERRLFRRPFGPDKLPLYEGYACIWASDDLEYEGGGAMHASAYNYYENKMAARVAKLIGKDPATYEHEAELILQAMRHELWLPRRGWFAEWKDWLGLQRVHPNAALWTFYHTLDSEVATPLEAWQMTRFVDTQIAQIPVCEPGSPEKKWFVLPTTSWMPYTWSLNNVVMAEDAHAALAYWQAQRPGMAFRLFKGTLLDHLYMGLCPGNIGMSSYFDVARGESQRDFADGIGATSRALVEGLFGVKPDALEGVITIAPGFPNSWNHASIKHEDFDFEFRRNGLRDTYVVVSRFPKPMSLELQIPARRDDTASVTVNGRPTKWFLVQDSVGRPRVEIQAAPESRQTVAIVWKGHALASAPDPLIAAIGSEVRLNFGNARVLRVSDPQKVLGNITIKLNGINGTIVGRLGQRTVFVRAQQGKMEWWRPISVNIRPAQEIIAETDQQADQLGFHVRNNTSEAINQSVTARFGGTRTNLQLRVTALGDSDEFVLVGNGLLPGSNPMTLDFGNGKILSGEITNWKISTSESRAKFEPISLDSVFNDKVTRIFENKYLSPRSPFCSLAIPEQGFGSWCHPKDKFDVDDSGLRSVSKENSGVLALPDGVVFKTPANADGKNIAFTSQWNNYPDQISIPLNGRTADHVYLLMAGSSNPMQSRFDNGEVIVAYEDGSSEKLALRNPTNWWPIDQDYFIDDYAFRRPQPLPPRVDLKTGEVRMLDMKDFKGHGGTIPGGAATVLDLPLDPAKKLKSLSVHALANEVVVGLMAVSLVEP